MTPPDREARKPTLTSTRVMRRPLLWRCSMTNMSSPTAPWTKSEEKRHHRNTQYHISDEERETKHSTGRMFNQIQPENFYTQSQSTVHGSSGLHQHHLGLDSNMFITEKPARQGESNQSLYPVALWKM